MSEHGNVVLTCTLLSSVIEILIGGIRCAATSVGLGKCVKVPASFR